VKTGEPLTAYIELTKARLKRAGKDSAALRETARNLAETSEFLKTYPPVTEAMGR